MSTITGYNKKANKIYYLSGGDTMQKKALVIIDIQNDITKNYKDVIGNINQAIDWAANHQIHVIYIRHENLSAGTRTFKPDTYYHMLYDISTSLVCHGFKKLAFLVCHGGNAPIVQVLSRELRSEFGISPFILSSGAFSHPVVTATISEGNIWDFHGGEMETSMVMAVDPSLVKSETSEAGIPTAFKDNQALKPYGNVSIGWVSEDWKTADGKPIGIGGDPSGATAEKGRIILETSAKVLVPGLKEIRAWKG